MCCLNLLQERIKKLTIVDFAIMKICLIAFALMVAKLWPGILALEWVWYAAIFAGCYVYLIYVFFVKK